MSEWNGCPEIQNEIDRKNKCRYDKEMNNPSKNKKAYQKRQLNMLINVATLGIVILSVLNVLYTVILS